MKIPITKPYFDGTEIEEIKESLESGWLVQGPKVRQFEQKFSEFTDIQYPKAVSSCTTALHMGLLALGVKEGQDVIVPSFTFIATPNSVRHTGAEIAFCDIDINTYNLEPFEVERLINKNYKKEGSKLINIETGNTLTTILTVHQFGLASNLPEINKIAEKYNLKVLEDGACAVGARINNIHVGNFGNIAAFSFHPRKSITTGEGGMVTTNDEKQEQFFEAIRSHGATKSDLQRHQKGGFLLPDFNILGYNYRMTDLQGGLGMRQMAYLPKILEKKHTIAQKYFELLEDIDCLIPPFTPEGYYHGYQSFVYRLNHEVMNLDVEQAHEKRNQLMLYLEENGIATRQGTHADHILGYYQDRYELSANDLPNSYKADRLSLALPMYFEMTDEEIEYTVNHIKKWLENNDWK